VGGEGQVESRIGERGDQFDLSFDGLVRSLGLELSLVGWKVMWTLMGKAK
jgi:hypothetical protein